MGSILNFVYDNIKVEEKLYETTLSKYIDGCEVKLHHIDEVNDIDKFFYVNQHNDYIFNQIKYGSPFTDKVSHTLKTNPNFNYIFFNEMESDTEDCIPFLENFLIENGYNPSQFFVINSNQKLPELKIKYNSNIKVLVCDVGNYSIAKHLQMYRHEYNINRNHLFMFYNRNVKPHRVAAVSFLNKMGLLDNFDWSWLRGDDLKNIISLHNSIEYWFQGILNKDDVLSIGEQLNFLKNIGVKKSIYEDYVVDVPPYFIDWDIMYKMNPYANSYINIICETNYVHNEIIHITEKCFAPLYFHQIPIVLSSRHHIKYLKEKYGFDLFEDIIDHSYDDEIDNRKRLFMVISEIERLNSEREKIENFFKDNYHRFKHNRDIIIKLAEEDDMKLFFQKLLW